MSRFQRATGSSGESPISDGTIRGAFAGFLMACITFASTLTEISTEQIAALSTLVTFGTFIMFGILDYVLKRPAAATEEGTRPD